MPNLTTVKMFKLCVLLIEPLSHINIHHSIFVLAGKARAQLLLYHSISLMIHFLQYFSNIKMIFLQHDQRGHQNMPRSRQREKEMKCKLHHSISHKSSLEHLLKELLSILFSFFTLFQRLPFTDLNFNQYLLTLSPGHNLLCIGFSKGLY